MECFASSAEFEELVPDDWELLYKETFDNDTGQPINLNTIDYGSDHPYYASNWTYTTVNSPGGEPEYERAAINESGVLKLTHPSSGTKGINVNAILKNPIDLMTDADYYLIFDGNFPGMGNVGNAGINSNSNSTMSNTPYILQECA